MRRPRSAAAPPPPTGRRCRSTRRRPSRRPVAPGRPRSRSQPWSRAAPAAAPAPAAAVPMIVTGSEAFAAGAFGFTPDSDYAAGTVGPRATAATSTARMPRLPDSDPAAAPPMATMVSSTAQAHAPAAGSSAAVKGRKKRKRNHFGKVVLVLLLLAGLVGGALMFGRDYLFPEDWNKDVVPAVEALQQRSGLEFVDPVSVNTLPEAEYAAKVAELRLRPGSLRRMAAVDPAVAGTRSRRRRSDRRVGERDRQRLDAGVLRPRRPADLPQRQQHRSSTVAMRDALAAALIDQLAGDPTAPTPDATAPTAATSPTDSLRHLAGGRPRRRARRRVDDAGPGSVGIRPAPRPARPSAARDRRPRRSDRGVARWHRRPRDRGRRFRRRRHRRAGRAVDRGTRSGA